MVALPEVITLVVEEPATPRRGQAAVEVVAGTAGTPTEQQPSRLLFTLAQEAALRVGATLAMAEAHLRFSPEN